MAGSTTNYGATKPAVGEAYDVNVHNNNSDIFDTQIKNRENFGKMERELLFVTNAFAWAGAYAAWDAGTISVDTSSGAASQMSSPQPAFAAAGSLSGAIKFTEPGMYAAYWWTGNGGNPGIAGYRIETSGTWPGTPNLPQGMLGQTAKSGDAFYFESLVIAPMIRVPTANLEIRLKGNQQNGTTNTGHIRILQLGKF